MWKDLAVTVSLWVRDEGGVCVVFYHDSRTTIAGQLDNYLTERERMIPNFGMLIKNLFGAVVLVALFVSSFQDINFRAQEMKILDDILDKDRYDKRLHPAGENQTSGIEGPANIQVHILIRSINSLDEDTMELSIQITLTSEWLDDRLQYDSMGGRIKSIKLPDSDKIWKPDSFFSNELDSQIQKESVLVRVQPNGYILYSTQISLRLSCPMDLHSFPMDYQICYLRLASYGYTSDDLVFNWKDPRSANSVQVSQPVQLGRYVLQDKQLANCTSTTTDGDYSCLQMNLLFSSQINYYVLEVYMPCSMIVQLSWLVFHFQDKTVPGRVLFSLIILLVMALALCFLNATLPHVSYTKAIDVWTGVCLNFVMAALLESVLVHYIANSDHERQQIKTKCKESDGHVQGTIEIKPLIETDGEADGAKEEVHCESVSGKFYDSWLRKYPLRSQRIDAVAKILFPILFIVFNLIYWYTYLSQEASF